MMIPMPATSVTVNPATTGGCEKRWTASHAMAPHATRRSMAFVIAARIEVLRRP